MFFSLDIRYVFLSICSKFFLQLEIETMRNLFYLFIENLTGAFNTSYPFMFMKIETVSFELTQVKLYNYLTIVLILNVIYLFVFRIIFLVIINLSPDITI